MQLTTAPDADPLDPLLRLPANAEIGVTEWISISQDEVDRFGVLTRDIDPVHMDPEWARAHGPFEGTVLYGFQTVSMLSSLLRLLLKRQGWGDERGHFVNYGFDRMRLVAPVRVGARIRGRFVLNGAERDAKGRYKVTFGATIEIENATRPALIADWLAVWSPAT